jgi:hypothetical protein
MNLKSMSTEELKELKEQIKDELDSREKKYGIYEHDCIASAKYHLGKYKHWAKQLNSVDSSKTNGFAFIGDWLSVNSQNKLPLNSIVVEFKGCEGSGSYTLYRITENGKEKIIDADKTNISELIDKAKELV